MPSYCCARTGPFPFAFLYMARLPRVVIAAVPHHVTQQGNARQVILGSDAERLAYLEWLREYSQPYALSLLDHSNRTREQAIAAEEGDDGEDIILAEGLVTPCRT
jgi:hypothetical protein